MSEPTRDRKEGRGAPLVQSALGGLPGVSVRRPLLALVLNVLIALAGVSALLGVEIRELPDIDRPVVSVRANFPGAAPETVDAEAASLVEAAVARVNGVVSVRTSSEENNFRLRAEFRPNVDLADAANDVREAVSRVVRRLPEEVEDLFVVKADNDARPIINLAVSSPTLPIEALTRLIETEIAPAFTAIEGVAEATLFGERERVIRVAVDPARLAAQGVSIAEISRVLEDADFNAPAGSFESEELEVLVRTDASAAAPSSIARLRVKGETRIGDVADVYAGPADPVSIVRFDGALIVSVGIVRQSKSNTLAISAAVEKVAKRLDARIRDVQIRLITDEAIFIRGAISEVVLSLALAVGIVLAVVGLFIGRVGATLVPAAAIPVSLLGGVAAIWLFGFSINLITLLALVLATGIVVDDAIVVLENIQRRRSEGLGRRAAAVIGTQQVFFAVIATTAVLISVFAPISFLPSTAGRMFREFGLVLAATVGVSSLVALSLAPMLASRLSNLGDAEGLRGGERRHLFTRFGDLYEALLRRVLYAPLVSVAGFILVAAAAASLYGALGQEISPPEDRGKVVLRAQGPDGVGLDHTDRQVEQMEALLAPYRASGEAVGLYSVTGWYDPNRARVEAILAPWDEREIGQQEIEAEVSGPVRRIPGARGRLQRGNSLGLRGSESGLNMALTGDQYPIIAETAETFADILRREIPALESVRVEYQATQPQISVAIDRERASELGVALEDLSATLRALVDGDEIAELTIGDRATPIILESSGGAVNDPRDLLNLTVPAAGGRAAPLYQLVSLTEQGVAAELDRHGQRRAVEIRTDLSAALTQADAVAKVRALAAEHLPSGIGLLFLGEAATLEETDRDVAFAFAIALLVVFLVLVAQFESLTSALVVMTTVPFGVCAAIMALFLSGVTLNIYSQIGVLMLIGVMAKNGVLMVEFADQLRDKGLSPLAAALNASRARLRAISMTMSATVLAGLPLILSSGPGAEARAAIGWVVFGGLGLGAVFTLFLTPAAYALIAGLSRPRAAQTEQLTRELEAAGVDG